MGPKSVDSGVPSAADKARERLHAIQQPAEAVLKLPIQIITKADISRLCREVDDIKEFFTQAAVKGATTKTVPQTSQLLTALINENKSNILHENDREQLSKFLNNIRQAAPVVHASFATDPKPDFLMKIVGWFRTEAHPYVLLQVGLQPSIAAGCIFRTTNKYFDFSFKKHFEDSKAKLGATLRSKA